MVFLYKSSWLHLFIIVFYYWDTLGGFWGPWMDFSTGAGGPKCLKWLNKMTTERMKMFTVTQNDYLRQKSGTKKNLRSLQITTRRPKREREQLQRDSHLSQRKATELQRHSKLSQRDNEEIPGPLLILVTYKGRMKGPFMFAPRGPLVS